MDEWIEFDGEATVHAILAGVGSVEELRTPARNFSGLGLRLLDVEKKVWADHARELEVSVRTIYPDIDQLGMAGVPVYAERGRHGGFALRLRSAQHRRRWIWARR